MRATIAHRSGRRQLAVDARGERRRRVTMAVRRGEAVDNPADAGIAAVQAAEELRRSRRGGTTLFGRDFAVVGVAGAVLVLVTDMSWIARAALLALALAVLIVAELALDVVVARRRVNAAKAEQANVAMVIESIASRYHATEPRPARRALPERTSAGS
jgi:hypothetical protein